MKKYAGVYWEHSSIIVEVEANSPDEAEQKIKDMVANGEVDLSGLELGDSGVETPWEIKDENKEA